VNNDAIYDLVRESFKDMATEARAADLMPATVRRMRRRTLSISLVAVSVVAALLIGIPVAVAAAGGTGGPGSSPGLTVTQSAPVPTRHTAEPSLTEPAGWSPAARRS
jgi:hypothetical protein